MADANPTVTKFQSDLARSDCNFGVLLMENGRTAEALTAYESALAIQKRLADVNGTATGLQSELANTHNNIGILLRSR